MEDKQRSWLSSPWIPGALVGVHLLLGIPAGLRTGVTGDEPVHLATGCLAWRDGEFRIDAIHPPLARMWLTWPLLVKGVKPLELRSRHLIDGNYWDPCRSWLQERHDMADMLRWPRIVNRAFIVALVFLVWLVLVRRTPLGALIAAGVLALSPNLLAHGGLATTDASFIFFYVAAILAMWRLTGRITVWWLLATGLIIGAALCCKFSSILLAPVCILLAAVRVAVPGTVEWRIARVRSLESAGNKAAALAVVLLAVAVLGYVVIWACYQFRYAAGPTDTTLIVDEQSGNRFHAERWGVDPFKVGIDPMDYPGKQIPASAWPVGVRALSAARAARLLPEAYLQGLLTVLYREKARHMFIMNRDMLHGVWYYFPVAMLVKTPISALIVLAVGVGLGIVALARMRWPWPASDPAWALCIGGVLFAAAAMNSDINIGLRHFLPVYPLLALLAAPPLAR